MKLGQIQPSNLFGWLPTNLGNGMKPLSGSGLDWFREILEKTNHLAEERNKHVSC
jgi:hypothetical protein